MSALLKRNKHGGIDRICKLKDDSEGFCSGCWQRTKCNADIFERLTQFDEIGIEPGTLKVIAKSFEYMVTEVCPHCESEITMIWDTKTMGYKAHCPVCGELMMLCDECIHAEDELNADCSHCDWHLSDDGESRCFRCPQE